MSFNKVDPKQPLPKMEEKIIKFWEEQKIFEKSLEKNKDKKSYVFYDGPPFATGTPHYGHIVASTMKDVVPRYWTMRGRYVERVWGWDCHGLPIENIAEKELGIKKKKEIETYGIEKFNEFCRSKVLAYAEDWKKVIKRLGRWADMENAYRTMDLSYMESVWWVFKELWDKGLIYEGYRSMYICTRCETTLSQQEIAEGYKDITDISLTAKFELLGDSNNSNKTYILAWTTTPWTLIGNVALAINEQVVYVKIKKSKIKNQNDKVKLKNDEYYILAKERVNEILKGENYEIISEFKGKDLVGQEYRSLFDYYFKKNLENELNGWKIYPADFVTTEEGTGIVHIAPAFGEDDLKLGQKYKLPFIQHVGYDGLIKKEATDFVGLSVKPAEDHQKTDVEIIKYLAKNNLLFAKAKYLHSYPHCWRCDTPLINYATSSWFVSVTKIKEKALESAKKINWSPSHLKEGRFGNWLEGARDWSISRQRFWASVIPIWKCSSFTESKNPMPAGRQENAKIKNKCDNIKVIGSVRELEKLSGQKITDLHKHIVDKITFKCEKCQGTMRRIPDVLDTWFDSGSMPYAQLHYPFENEKKFDAGFPAEFIAEGVDQTRAWFYYLHIIATAIKKSRAYNNVIVNGIVTGEDGKKLSKRLKNYPDPMEMFAKYGADALRYYLLSSPVVAAENLELKESDVADLVRGMFRMLWNSYSFFVLYANIDGFQPAKSYKLKAKSLLDKWIISELNLLIKEVNVAMENYELNRACRLFPKFIDNLSNWYIRRSRRRFWKSENDGDKNEAYQTLHLVLVELSKLMAPFTPFVADEIYRNLTVPHPDPLPGGEGGTISVHLADFPEANEKLINDKLNKEMEQVRNIVSVGLQLRAQNKIKVRQPLSELQITNCELRGELVEIIKEEVNVKAVKIVAGKELKVELNTQISKELKLEGIAREIIRYIQEMRKEAGYEVDNRIAIGYHGALPVFQKFNSLISREVLANKLSADTLEAPDLEKEFEIEGEKIEIQIKKEG